MFSFLASVGPCFIRRWFSFRRMARHTGPSYVVHRPVPQYYTHYLLLGQVMPKQVRIGRPRGKLAAAKHLVTRRVRRLIDLAHEGNVHEASRALGIPYATIRDLYVGRGTNPSHKTLKALVDTYGVYDGWFMDSSQQEEVPLGGWKTYVSGYGGDHFRDQLRGVLIPFSAWPLGNLFQELGETLAALPVSIRRPIVKDADEEGSEFNRRLGDFLLSPLIIAEKASGQKMVLEIHSKEWDKAGEQEKWIRRMRILGKYWADVFPELLSGIKELGK